MIHRTSITAVSLALVLALSACGSQDSTSPSDTTAAPATGPASAVELNDADVEFAQGMIAHHEQAVAMTEIALDPTVAASAAVTDLARRISDAQESEIGMMTSWLTAAGESITMDMSDGHDMSSMAGMMSAEDMDALAKLTGSAFDEMWLTGMIAHHEGAIEQSETVLADGSNAEVRALAEEIVAAQQAEIDEMRALLGS